MVPKARTQSDEFRKLMLLARSEIGLTDDERHELGEYLLRRDLRSWSELEPHQVNRLLDACEGYLLIDALKRLRPPTPSTED